MSDVDHGYALLAANLPAEARTVATGLLERDQYNARAWLLCFDALHAEGRYEAVVNLAGSAITAVPDDPLVRTAIALAATDAGRHELAIDHARDALARAPDLGVAYAVGALANARGGDVRTARRDLNAAVAYDPTDPMTLWLCALGWLALYDDDAAAGHLDALLQIEPNHAGAHLLLSDLHTAARSDDTALAHAIEAERLAPGPLTTSSVLRIADRQAGQVALLVTFVTLLTARLALTLGVSAATVSVAAGMLLAVALAVYLARSNRLPQGARVVMARRRIGSGYGPWWLWAGLAFGGWQGIGLGTAVLAELGLVARSVVLLAGGGALLAGGVVGLVHKWRRSPPTPSVPGSASVWAVLAGLSGLLTIGGAARVAHPVSKVLVLALAVPLTALLALVAAALRRNAP